MAQHNIFGYYSLSSTKSTADERTYPPLYQNIRKKIQNHIFDKKVF